MIVLDLKLAGFVVLLLSGGLLYWGLTALWQRRRNRFPLATTAAETAALQRQLDTAPIGLLLFDAQGERLYANQVGQRLLAPGVADELHQDVQTAVAQADDNVSHYRILNLPNEQALSWWICPLPRSTLVLLLDLSQQRQLERASQLFLSNLSHELRTPLTAILAHIEVMRTPDVPRTVRDNSLAQIHQETNRISRLVQNLLALSRLEATPELQLRPVDLLLLAEEVIADLILVAEARDIRISLQADTALPHVLADPDQLKQVFLNLLDNAMKYGRAGDKIDVILQPQADGVQVTIRDSGPGIPAQHLPHVTDRLYRARTDVEGSGLGLAIAAEILRRHHSRLQIESKTDAPETGTTVTFQLPA